MNEQTLVAQASPPVSPSGVPPGELSASGGGTPPKPAGGDARATLTALAAATGCAVAHYTFGDWAGYPHVALWRERAFWASIPAVALIPLLHWAAWSVLSLGRLKPARIIFVAGVVLCLGDLGWFLIRLNLNTATSVFKLPLARVAVEWEELWGWWLPVVVLAGNLFLARRWWQLFRKPEVRGQEPEARSQKSEVSQSRLRGSAAAFSKHYLGAAALLLGCGTGLLTAIHLVLPRMAVSDLTLSLADTFLVPAEWGKDFAFVAQTSACQGKRLGALLDHASLAHLQHHHFYQNLDQSVYEQFVLSPVIDALPLSELDWRRTLWERFFPRVRHDRDPALAAQIVVRCLRERVGIDPSYCYRVGVETIWTQQMTDEAGFERIYVAALRSVGTAARLGGARQAEFWNGRAWLPAPRPASSSPQHF
jgi:hypothetical protein